jgi:hypothetical protein
MTADRDSRTICVRRVRVCCHGELSWWFIAGSWLSEKPENEQTCQGCGSEYHQNDKKNAIVFVGGGIF